MTLQIYDMWPRTVLVLYVAEYGVEKFSSMKGDSNLGDIIRNMLS